MSFIPHLGTEVKDINPDFASPLDVLQVCFYAQIRLNQMLTHGMPLSEQERQTEAILNEIDTVAYMTQTEDIHAKWKDEKLAREFLNRLSELEEDAYNILLTSIEKLEDGNPLRDLAAAYQKALALKAKGEISPLIMLDPTQSL